MANKKKISELTPITPVLTDLIILDRPANGNGAPVTGHTTLSELKELLNERTDDSGPAPEPPSSTPAFRISVLDHASIRPSTNHLLPTVVGQVIFPGNQFEGSLVLKGVISNSEADASTTVLLYNVRDSSYVHIGGPGVSFKTVTGHGPTIITSVDLITATNFIANEEVIYELHVYSNSPENYSLLGGFELRPAGSFSGVTHTTSNHYYTSGTWEDSAGQLATTASVAIAGNLGPGYFSSDVGTDAFFFVSGAIGGKDGHTPGVAVFGGDLHISGNLTSDKAIVASAIAVGENGYIDIPFVELEGAHPILRVDPSSNNPSVRIGTYGSENLLLVNGIDITPHSGSQIVLAGSVTSLDIMDLKNYMPDDCFGMVNIDVFSGTLATSTLESSSNAAWKLYVTFVKKGADIKVVNVTQLENHKYDGASSQNSTADWDVNVTIDGLVQVRAHNQQNDVAFGAVVTKVSVLDTVSGNMVR